MISASVIGAALFEQCKALTGRTTYDAGTTTDGGKNDGWAAGMVVVPCVVKVSPDEITYSVSVWITTVTVLVGTPSGKMAESDGSYNSVGIEVTVTVAGCDQTADDETSSTVLGGRPHDYWTDCPLTAV
jgi:hypothetical protein